MTAPDILPHLGNLVLLALFIAAAASLGIAIWLQAGDINRLETRIASQDARLAEFDERLAHQEAMQKEMAKILERFVVNLVSDAIGGKRGGDGGDHLDEIMPTFGRNGWRS